MIAVLCIVYSPNVRHDPVLTEHSFREYENIYNFDGI